jgi:hypothetical protein
LTPSTELTQRDQELAALQAQQEEEFAGDTFQTPILKLCQPLTREVQEDQAEAGDFLNTLSGETLGTQIDFIVSYYEKGRSAADRKNNRYYIAFSDAIPDSWSDLVGEEFVGTPFAEYPDAEEEYKRRVNSGEIEWEKGPLISTTYNYTGYVIVPPPVGDEDGEAELQPVRLSLQRSNKKAADKINTIRRAILRGKPLWDKVLELSTARKTFNSGTAYVLNVKAGRDTTAEEREAAGDLALAVIGGRTVANEDAEAPAAAAPAPASSGLDI